MPFRYRERVTPPPQYSPRLEHLSPRQDAEVFMSKYPIRVCSPAFFTDNRS